MLTMHITEADATALTAADPGRPDGLVACLAHYGVAHDVIQTALATLAQVKTVVLYKPSVADAWEMQARTP
jgi:hypothetical protein